MVLKEISVLEPLVFRLNLELDLGSTLDLMPMAMAVVQDTTPMSIHVMTLRNLMVVLVLVDSDLMMTKNSHSVELNYFHTRHLVLVYSVELVTKVSVLLDMKVMQEPHSLVVLQKPDKLMSSDSMEMMQIQEQLVCLLSLLRPRVLYSERSFAHLAEGSLFATGGNSDIQLTYGYQCEGQVSTLSGRGGIWVRTKYRMLFFTRLMVMVPRVLLHNQPKIRHNLRIKVNSNRKEKPSPTLVKLHSQQQLVV